MANRTGHIEVPADLIEVGHISGAYGIRGWARIVPYSAEAGAMLKVKDWWLDLPELHNVKVMQARRQGDEIVAHFSGIDNREAAEALRGSVICISRSRFPTLQEDEYYWVDLIGLSVFNLRGDLLGTVRGLIDNGVHPILQVTVDDSGSKVRELLIPFVDQFIDNVDRESGKITVDWELDY